ncbi:MAG: carboxypeptidase regulatory-like domain-containing protein [Euryarchaeota archaeon]|nr:carboxypeptidase regulatory-like domain-containing protein [Euryarchaeota archaeon]
MSRIGRRLILGSVFVMMALALAGFSASAENGWVKGKIGDNSLFPFMGNPIAGATVKDANGAASATTAADGSFNLTLPEGNYTLKISAPGYKDKLTDTITVTANNTTTHNDYLTKPSGNITGKVTEDDGSAMVAASVVCQGVSTSTGLDGKYTLANVPVGTWNLTVTPFMGTPINFSVTVTDGQVTTKDLTITVPSPVIVTVIDQKTGPIANATVTFGTLTGKTDALGMVTLNGGTPGTYKLTVTAKGYKTYSKDHALERGGVMFTVPMSKSSTDGGKGFIPGFEALPVLAVAALAALVIRRRLED